MSEMFNIQTPFRKLGQKTKGDKFIWGIVVLLAIASLLVVYSATGSLAYKMYKGNTEVYLFKQLSFIIMGIVLIYFLHLINYTIYSRSFIDPVFAFNTVIDLYFIFWRGD